jgi:serine/threonine-protein kinase
VRGGPRERRAEQRARPPRVRPGARGLEERTTGDPMKRIGKYTIIEKIGSGGMAEIYKAALKGAGGFEKVVVLKKVLPGYANNESFIRMLVQEAKLASLLHHPNIVQIYELGEEDHQYYIAMEYVHGKDLLKILSQCAKLKRRLPIEAVLFIVAEVASALDHAHQATDLRGQPLGIIHRDVSPSNIIMSYDGNVKIMDFGVAKAKVQSGEKTRVGVLKGKIGYMSPEQVMGKEIDRRSDIFSLGVILYEAIVLKRLFLGKADLETLLNIRDVRVDKKIERYKELIPDPIEKIMRMALAKNADERYQTAGALRDAIYDYLFEQKTKYTATELKALLGELFDKEDPLIPETFLQEEDEEPSGTTSVATVADAVEPSSAPVIASLTSGSGIKLADLKAKAGTMPFDVGDAKFQVKGPNGEVFGPISFENLMKMMKAGAISDEELISVDEGSWKEPRDLNMFQGVSQVSGPVEAKPPLYQGDFTRLTIPRLLFNILKNRLSGRLLVKQRATSKNIYIKNNRISHVTSNLKNELLGVSLLKRGIISQKQVDEAVEYSRTKGAKLGASLIALKYIRPYELSRLMELFTVEKLEEIFTWQKGEYRFYDQEFPAEDVILISVDIPPALTAAVRKTFRVEDYKVYFKDRIHRSVLRMSNARVKVEEMGFTPRETRLLGVATAARTLGEALQTRLKGDEEIQIFFRTLFLCLEAGIVNFQSR